MIEKQSENCFLKQIVFKLKILLRKLVLIIFNPFLLSYELRAAERIIKTFHAFKRWVKSKYLLSVQCIKLSWFSNSTATEPVQLIVLFFVMHSKNIIGSIFISAHEKFMFGRSYNLFSFER